MPTAQPDHHRQPSHRRLEVITRRHRQACLAAIGPDEIRARYGGPEDAAWSAIVDMDPSVNHRHLQWLCRQVEAGKLKPEDFYKAAPLLQELQRTAPLLRSSGITRDLNQYRGLPEISAALRPFAEQLTGGEIDRKERARVDEETIVHHRCENLLVVEPKTERASCYWGRGTQWCTAATEADNAFKEYTKDGNRLFIYILSDGTKYQACTNGEMANAEDKRVAWAGIKAEHQAAMLASAALEDLSVLGEESALPLLNGSPRFEELCWVAARQDGRALRFVTEHMRTLGLCELAVRQDGRALEHVPERLLTQELCELAVRQDGRALRFAPAHLISVKMCELAVKNRGWMLEHVPKCMRTKELCEVAVRQDGWNLGSVPDNLRTRDLCEVAVRLKGGALRVVPDHLKTAELCEVAVRRHHGAIHYVPADIAKLVTERARTQLPAINAPDQGGDRSAGSPAVASLTMR